MRLHNMQASVISSNGTLVLVSYETPVVLYANGNIILGTSWNCSQSTLRQVKVFLKEFTYLKYSNKNIDKAFIQEQLKQGKFGLIGSIAY